MFRWFLSLLYPPRCVLCNTLLSKNETDLCHDCRKNAPEVEKSNLKFSFLAGWTSIWYYRDNVRHSLLRYKFANRRSYAQSYGRLLAMKLQKEGLDDVDLLTYIPIAPRRRLSRGYDQVALLAYAVGKELGIPVVRTLRKIRNTPPQSGLGDIFRRRANILGAYQTVNNHMFFHKRILLLDDIITTGATASECARMLRIAGADQVYCASVAVATHNLK